MISRSRGGPLPQPHAARRRRRHPTTGSWSSGAPTCTTIPTSPTPEFLVRHLPGVDAHQKVRPQLPALAPAFTRDFLAGRVVTVQGWQLSRAEARAAAAVALGR